MRPRWIKSRRTETWRQAEMPFLRRSRRLDRAFKAIILGLTSVVLAALIFGTPPGRRLAWNVRSGVIDRGRSLLGMGVERSDFEARRDRARRLGIEYTRTALGELADRGGSTLRDFLRETRLDRDSAVVRWGNYDWTLALSSSVFEPDDSGRSYRLRPKTRSVWLVGLTVAKVQAMFEIPDTPEARRLGQQVGGKVVPESVQLTNSWGCRGAEPDPSAPLRGIILGDSNMQGLLVGDDQTPPARLEARLRAETGKPVSILNTGHLGYSPEQYYQTLLAYIDRFPPHFIVISLCANDFGNMNLAENWDETRYWLDAITQLCRTRNIFYLAVPMPLELSMLGRRNDSVYPARISEILSGSGVNYLDPIQDFTAVELELRADAMREGRWLPYSPLFNGQYADHHLSPLGCDLWAELVARRLRLAFALRAAPGNLDR